LPDFLLVRESKEKGTMKEKAIVAIVFTALMIVAMFAAFPTKAQFVGQIKIGIIGPVGLPHWSPAGMKEASEMAAEEINAAGGVHLADGDYEIVLVFGDEKAYPTPDPVGAALEMERLITVEGCEFIIGGFRSEVTGALIEVAMDYDIPFVINGASTSEFLSETVGVDYEKYKYLFRVNPVNSTILFQTIAGGAQFLLPTKLLPLYGHDLGGPNPQVKVAVITEDLKWTETMHYYLTNPAIYPSVLGPYANVTYAGRIPDGTTDCSTWLTDVINSEARLLIHVFSGVTGVPFIMQWNAMNVKALPLGINVMGQLQTHWDTTGGGCEYEAMLNFVGTRTPIIPGVTEVFWDKFVAKTGVWPIYTAFGAYNGINILAEALEATGTKDKDTLVDHFEDPAYESAKAVNGKTRFSSLHDVFCNEVGPFWTEGYTRAFVVQWQAGLMEVVSPVDQAFSKRWAIPPWMYELTTDLNFDGTVNIMDISTAAVAFGTKPGDPRWEMEADINGDSTINIIDIAAIAKDFGKSVSLPLP
jgi:branched-chain amino acid transport system substrate-binding protein